MHPAPHSFYIISYVSWSTVAHLCFSCMISIIDISHILMYVYIYRFPCLPAPLRYRDAPPLWSSINEYFYIAPSLVEMRSRPPPSSNPSNKCFMYRLPIYVNLYSTYVFFLKTERCHYWIISYWKENRHVADDVHSILGRARCSQRIYDPVDAWEVKGHVEVLLGTLQCAGERVLENYLDVSPYLSLSWESLSSETDSYLYDKVSVIVLID
jgi:hypothetical protein